MPRKYKTKNQSTKRKNPKLAERKVSPVILKNYFDRSR